MADTFNRTLRTSLVMHVLVIFLLLVVPLISRCTYRPKKPEEIFFVEMVSPQASVPAPQIPQPEPELPKPEPLPPKPEPKPEIVDKPPVEKPKIKVNTNKVVRKEQPPPPKPAPPATSLDVAKDLMDALPQLPAGAVSSGNPTEMGIYHGKVYKILYDAWDQPPGVGGLRVETTIRIARNGAIMDRKVRSGSGGATMEQSVRRALNSVSMLPPLPASVRGSYYDLDVTFQTTGQ